MKKSYKHILMIVIVSLILVGCDSEMDEYNIDQTTSAPVRTNAEKTTISELPLSTTDEITTSTVENGCYSDTEYIKQMDGYIQYVNEDFGFTVDFPQYWENNFLIEKSNDRTMWRVAFLGKSDLAKSLLPPVTDVLMFWIISQVEIDKGGLTLDGTIKIGELNGENYYYATSTDHSIGYFENEDGMYDDFSEEEKERIKADDELIKKMAADAIEVVKTFKEIEP